MKEESLYGSKLVRLSAPRFVVFYNGTDARLERQTLRLPDAFLREQEKPALVAMRREFGETKQETVGHLVKKLGITLERAEKGIEKYWE